jgi:methylthioribose-1-phosphate isomerase
MNVLIAGIPTPDLVSHVTGRYGEDVKLFVAESRPFEEFVAREAAAVREAGHEVTICTDNTIASLFVDYEIGAVWSLYSELKDGAFVAINGARMAAILADAFGVPFMLFHHGAFSLVDNGHFAGQPVTVPGVDYVEQQFDAVPSGLVAEAV